MVHGIGASHGARDEKQFNVHGNSHRLEKTPTIAVKAEIEIQDPYLAVFHKNALKKKQDSADILLLPFQQPQVAVLAMAQKPTKLAILPVAAQTNPASTVVASSSTTVAKTSVTPSGATSQSVTSSSAIQLTPGVNPFTGQPN